MSRHGVTLCIAADHPALPGHFPGFPIVPGVVLLDETLHAIERLQGSEESSWQIDAVKFHHVVRPGDELQLTFEWQPDAPVHFELRTQQALVASGSIKRRPGIHAVPSA
jgi:3-hydroxymyristoyl/3-hydroxydecanoyl-(acyl carrier protein) dehydratase